MARGSLLKKTLVWLVALGVLAVLFIRSAQSSREAPFPVERADLTPWTLVLDPDRDMLGAWLALQPPTGLIPPLGRQIFSRAAESVHYPNPPTLPVILRSEFEQSLSGVLEPEAVMALAREAGLESAMLEPRCMGRRRVSEPGGTRTIYFVVFDAPAFGEFRLRVGSALARTASGRTPFDPVALSPALIVAATDGNFVRWLPLRASLEVDCLAPIEIE